MKSQFQDIIPPEKRSIRNIPLAGQDSPDTKSVVEEPTTQNFTYDKDEKKEPETQTSDMKPLEKRISFYNDPKSENLVYGGGGHTGGFSKVILWSFTIVAVFVLFFSVTHFLHSAQITIETKKISLDLPDRVDMTLASSQESVKYSVISYKDSIRSEAKSSGEKESLEKAKGTIIIYNNFDNNNQKLTTGTRFETKSGLVYKLLQPVVVPGIKKINDKNVPGSIEVVVEAEKPGSDYNIGLEDFTIPGLKGDPRFDKFYARSKTSMTGGSVGKIPIIAENDIQSTTDDLKEKISTRLKDRLKKEIPKDQLIFENLLSIEYESSKSLFENNKSYIEVVATIKAYVIDKNSLAKNTLSFNKLKVTDKQDFELDVRNISSISIVGTTSPTLSFSGKLDIKYLIDTEEFKSKSAGLTVGEILNMAKGYESVATITTVVKPFWKKTIPANFSKIDIITK